MTATATLVRPLAPGAVRRAARDIVPIAAAVVPFGMVVGVTLSQAGLVGLPALIATAMLYAGSAQLATLSVIIAGGGPIGAILAGSVVNARMLLYSAGLSDRFERQPSWFRWVGPWTTVDQTFALATAAKDLDDRSFRQYWLTMGIVLGAFWLTAVGVGMELGTALSHDGPLQVTAPAVFLTLLVPSLHDARMRRVAGTAAVVALLGRSLPSGFGIVLAIVAALAAAGPTTTEEDS